MADLATLVPLTAVLLAIGAFAGLIAGLLGVGGGIVLVPAFLYTFTALGYDSPQLMQICLATSLATIIVTSLRSVHSHNKKGAVDAAPFVILMSSDFTFRWGCPQALRFLADALIASY